MPGTGRAAFGGTEAGPPRDTECAAELARFFPGTVRMRIPAELSKADAAGELEQTVIEFGSAEEILFVSPLALDFDDIVRLQNSDGSLDITAKIVAMRFHHGKMAVAARFLEDVANWIIKA